MDFAPCSASAPAGLCIQRETVSRFTNVKVVGKDNCRCIKREFLTRVTIVSQEIVFPSFLALPIVDQLFPQKPPL